VISIEIKKENEEFVVNKNNAVDSVEESVDEEKLIIEIKKDNLGNIIVCGDMDEKFYTIKNIVDSYFFNV
jgi:hypothetical protein